MTRAVKVTAYCKINWTLELLGKRDDGYHEIRTVVQNVSLADYLAVSITEGGVELTVTGEWPVPADESNLCWRAAEAFRERWGTPAGVHITLDKRVPPGSGLGGGSSDAVGTLAALARLTRVEDQEGLAEVAASLGSDTALFLQGGTTLCTGRGEIVEKLPDPQVVDMVLARPECSVATSVAYGLIGPDDFTDGSVIEAVVAGLVKEGRRRDRPSGVGGTGGSHLRRGSGATPDRRAVCPSTPRPRLDTSEKALYNAFRRPVCARYAEIDVLAREMLAGGAWAAQMTGSGSAVFGLVEHRAEAERVARGLSALGYWAVAAHSVPVGYLLEDGEQSGVA